MTEATVKLKKDICRCCYTEGIFNNLDVPIVVDGKRELYSDMLDTYLNITLQSTSGLTSMTLTICDLCTHRLIDACKFKIQVLACETKLQQLINESNKVSDKNSLGNNIEVKEEFVNFFEDDLFEEKPGPNNDAGVEIDECGDYADEHTQDPPENGAQRNTTNTLEGCSTVEIVNFDDAEKLVKLCGDEEKVPKINVQKRELPDKYPNIKISDIKKLRTNINEINSCTNATPIRKYGVIGYACCFCTEQFPKASDLKTHTRESHPIIQKAQFMTTMDVYKFNINLDITDLKCNLCEIAINTLEDALLHLLNKHSRPVYTDIKNYIMPFKFDSDSLRCCICENIFHTFKYLQKHMNEHYRNFICDVCNAGFINREKLRQHSISHKVDCFKCDQCPKTFNTEHKRKAHVLCIHCGFKYKCGYCPEKFKTYKKKHEHLRQVHDISSPPIKCQACDKTFLEQRFLYIHVKKDHLRERRYSCTECGKKFFAASDLKKHMVKYIKLRKFTCPVCLKSYRRKNTLSKHIKIHEDRRKYECAHCGQAFVSKYRLIKHMRSEHLELV